MSSSLEEAWSNASSKLRAFIAAKVRDHAAAEDILQDVFLRAHTRIAQLRSGDKIEGWLHLIARNAVIDHYRKTRPAAAFPLELAAPEPDLHTTPEAENLLAAFREMASQLPDPYREALLLAEFKGLTHKELAERQGISLSAAKSRVQRGREKLKQRLLQCCALEFDRRGAIIDCAPRQSPAQCAC